MLTRGEDRGLGNMTWEIHRNLRPDRTLLVDLGELARGFPTHPDRFPGADQLSWDGHPLDADGERQVRAMLEDIDVLYSAETFYDWRIVDWCRDAGVASVLHVMPEFWRCGTDSIPIPDAVWAPTRWRLEQLPEQTRLVPVPVALDRFDAPELDWRSAGDPLRVLHVGGHRAAADRNGTHVVLRAAQRMRERVVVTVVGQDRRLPSGYARRGGPVELVVRPGGVGDYWSNYAGHDVLLMPRRYGGLCLPVQEGLAAGLVPIMPDVEPNGDWPAVLVPAHGGGTIATPGGVLKLAQTKPADVAAAVDRLARDRAWLAGAKEAARSWTLGHSWEALAPLWRDELARAR